MLVPEDERWPCPLLKAGVRVGSRYICAMLYLDHNATTRPHPQVIRALAECMGQSFGNPSSLHWAGQDSQRALDSARNQVAALLDCRADEITFTSGATEANNMVLRGVVHAAVQAGRAFAEIQIVTTAIEHKSVLNVLAEMELLGVQVSYVPAGWDGKVNARQIEACITAQTVLVTVMLANNDTGVLQPLEDIVRYAHAKGVPVHSDATQAVGKVLVQPRQMGIDYLSLSAHKLYGPKGVGALWMRNGNKLLPLLHGGKQELGMRAGTENLPGIVGMGVAAELAHANLKIYAKHCVALRERLQQGILCMAPQARIYGELAERVPNTLLVGFPGFDGMSLMLQLDLAGIAVSVGSACGAGDHEPSHVLRGMGCTELESLSTIRISLGLTNTEAEMEFFLQTLAKQLGVQHG